MKYLIEDIIEFMRETGITSGNALLAHYGGETVKIKITPDGAETIVHGRLVYFTSKTDVSDELYIEECLHTVRRLVEFGLVEFSGESGEHKIEIKAYADRTFEMTVDGEVVYSSTYMPGSLMRHYMS